MFKDLENKTGLELKCENAAVAEAQIQREFLPAWILNWKWSLERPLRLTETKSMIRGSKPPISRAYFRVNVHGLVLQDDFFLIVLRLKWILKKCFLVL